jgi:hypothetical protein
MPLDGLAQWAQFGLGGAVICALFALIWYLVEGHKSERKEWLAAYSQHSEMADNRQKETNEILREMTSVMAESNVRHSAKG